jgi:hypothetical protein
MRMWLISTRVKKPENDDPSLLEPVELAATGQSYQQAEVAVNRALLYWLRVFGLMVEETCEPGDSPMTADTAPAADVQSHAKIFISYSRKDLPFADRLEAALKARGFEPLIDRTEIYAFEDWWKRIEVLIGRADTVVFVLSPDAVASDVALREVAHATSLNKRFAPVVCRRIDDGAVPEALRRLNFVFFDDPERFEAAADQLAEALNTDIGWIRQHTEYGEAARRWEGAKRPKGLLLRSPVLEEAERWIASRPASAPIPLEETGRFIQQSRHEETRRRKTLIGSLSIGLVVAMLLAGYAFYQKQVAEKQTQVANQNLVTSKLTETKLLLERNDLLAAVTAAMDADHIESTYQLDPRVRLSRGALQQVIAANRLVLHLHRMGSVLPKWPFEFLNSKTLAYTTEKDGLFVVDLSNRRLLWHIDLPGFNEPEAMQVSILDDLIVVVASAKLAVIDSHGHALTKTLEFPSPIRALSLSPADGRAAAALDDSLVLFDPDDAVQKKTVSVPQIGQAQRIKRISFDRSGKFLYVSIANDLGDNSLILEYDLALERFKPVTANDVRTIADDNELSAYLGADRTLIYSSSLRQKFGLFDASTGVVSDLRDGLQDVGRMTGAPALFPVSLHHPADETPGQYAALFSISRSFVQNNEAMTLAVHLVSKGRILLNPKEIKYRAQKTALVFRCRASDLSGYLACYLSTSNGSEWLAVWTLSNDPPPVLPATELLSAAERLHHRLTEYDDPKNPYAADAPRDRSKSLRLD